MDLRDDAEAVQPVGGDVKLLRGLLELLRGDRAAATERERRAREAAAHYEREKGNCWCPICDLARAQAKGGEK